MFWAARRTATANNWRLKTVDFFSIHPFEAAESIALGGAPLCSQMAETRILVSRLWPASVAFVYLSSG
jgi:hypothetical protein